MAIIKVNNTSEESSVNFLTNQSSILYTSDTNKITVNGVNVFVNKPKIGDIMCVTRYTDDGGALLPADQQQVKWIDGLSINPKQLSQKYEPVGICVAINGNKAMVRYREEGGGRWSAADRWEIPQLLQIINQKSHNYKLHFNQYGDTPPLFKYNYNSLPSTFEQESDFVNQLNDWFLKNKPKYSAEVVDKDTDLPVQDTGHYRIIVNASVTESVESNLFIMEEDVKYGKKIKFDKDICKPVKAVNFYYINNGFTRNCEGGCCRAMYYDTVQKYGNTPTSVMENINYVPGGLDNGKGPARLVDFNNNDYCQILRDNFANYDEYLESFMIKVPCGAGGQITEFPSGKENTYKLANCTFLNNTGKQETLYPVANWAASINVNGPNLGKGNWWIPSIAEMALMMRDITFGTSFWETNPDIVNRVLYKLYDYDYYTWSLLQANTDRWTSSKYGQISVYYYRGQYSGATPTSEAHIGHNANAITVYEF